MTTIEHLLLLLSSCFGVLATATTDTSCTIEQKKLIKNHLLGATSSEVIA